MDHSTEDEALVEAQLGRPLRGTWSVARRCHLGIPMVIENHPRLDDGSPFPTLYWLTCPIMVKRASKLESEGWMEELNDRLATDDGLRSRLRDSIDRYKTARDEHEQLVPAPAPPGGGPGRVKCLHAHTAHELASFNPVGSLVLSLAGYPDCREPCVTLR